MNGTDINQHKAVLMAVREVIVQKSRQREAIWVAQSNKLMETVQLTVEWDFAIRAQELENRWLRQVDAALERIDDGEFGTCLECEEPISPERLAAVPWATYCLRCQKLNDSRQERRPPGPNSPHEAAFARNS